MKLTTELIKEAISHCVNIAKFEFLKRKRKNDELFKRKVKLIKEKIIDYYATFYDDETAELHAEQSVQEAIRQNKIDFLYSKHIRENK